METQEQKTNKQNWKAALGVFTCICIYAGLVWLIVAIKSDLREANTKIQEEQKLNSTCSYKRDSLLRENKQYKAHQSLHKAISHRDEATSLLPHKIGDAVYLKRDSVRVVIEDIVIGGAKYEYYVKYRVLHKDKTTEEVKPEMVY